MHEDFIPLMIPDIREEDIEAVVEVLRSGRLVQGEKVEALEKSIAGYLGIKHAIAVSNGTASLHLALIVMGVGPGDEVIVPAFSYIATANVVELVGAKPIFVDIKLETFNIDVARIENNITPATKAIIPVHEFGLACDIKEVMQIAKKYNLKVIEDAACALGATDKGQYAGTFGDIGSFSFHPRKAITGGEGGMLVTNNDSLAEGVRTLRNHGIKEIDGKTEFVAAGFNYRMTDFQAALILSQFKRFEQILEQKKDLACTYIKALEGQQEVKIPREPDGKRHTWQSFHIVLDDNFNRDTIIQKLREYGVGSNYGAQCIPFQEYYRAKYHLNCKQLFPNALKAFQKGLVLPLYYKITQNELESIAKTIRSILSGCI